MFLPKKLDNPQFVGSAKNSLTGEMIKVGITFKKERKAGDRESLQHYNILFGRIFKMLKMSQHNRKHFDAMGRHTIKVNKEFLFPCREFII